MCHGDCMRGSHKDEDIGAFGYCISYVINIRYGCYLRVKYEYVNSGFCIARKTA